MNGTNGTAPPLRIAELRVQNVKRIQAVHIKPDGSVIEVNGKNGAGKSTVLDSIAMALGGKDLIPREPLRRGATEGQIVVDLGEMKITRTFGEGGKTALKVTRADGAPVKSPQTFLDALVAGGFAFDPSQFCRLDAKRQAEALRRITGLDFTDLDQERERVYNRRTEINRLEKASKAQLDAMAPPQAGLPAERVVVADLIAERDAMKEQIAMHAQARQKLETLHANLNSAEAAVVEAERALAAAKEARDALAERVRRGEGIVAELEDPDTAELDRKIASADAMNTAIANAATYRAKQEEHKAHAAESAKLTTRLDELDAAKAARLEMAEMPVKGLGFDDSGVTFNGIPFDQCSTAERLRVSMAIALAQHPQLRVVLLRDGNDLDADSMALLAQMAEEAGAQVFVERIEASGDGGILIEDGMVRAEPALV